MARSHPPNQRRSAAHRPGFKREFQDLLRAAAGGFLFGIPLLYTMEVWWIGSSVNPPIMLMAMITTLLVVFALTLTAGFRKSRAMTVFKALGDTLNAVAVGLLSAGLMLILLREITLQTELRETLGKVIFEGVPFALGAALANQFLSADNSSQSPTNNLTSQALERFFPDNNFNETLADIGATLVGALIIAFSIAPTDEVPVLVSGIQGPWLLGLVFSSLIISYVIVFQANLTCQKQRQMQQGLFQSPLSETIMSYLVSLGAATVMLIFFQQIDWTTPWEVSFRHILILGLPATIGGAAGRLVL